METDGLSRKRRLKPLGPVMPRIPLRRHIRRPLNLANIVRGQVLVAEILGTLERSANSVERDMGWVRARTDGDGYETTNLRIIDRARSGLQPLSEEKLDLLETRFPSLRSARKLLFWTLLDNGTLPTDTVCGARRFLHDQSYWIVHTPIILSERHRDCACRIPLQLISNNALARLALLGTLDGVTALWLLLREAIEVEDDPMATLRIGKHIPAAIALYGCSSSTCFRVAVLIFARMRQLILDKVEANGQVLDLKKYDLAAASASAASWASSARPYPEADAENAGKTVLVCEQLQRWVECWIAPTRSADRHEVTACWQDRFGPGAYLSETENRKFPLHSGTVVTLKKALGDYW